MERAITPEVAEHLNVNGYAVVDGIFGPELTAQLRAEVVRLYETGLMHKNCTNLVRDNATSLVEKAHIHEAELTLDSGVQSAAPLCASLHRDRTLATLLSLFLPQLTLDAQAIKLQYNAGGGGCFPIHTDSDELLDGRRVTAIFYLNPDWTPVHGGQLRLYPFPRAPLDVAPLADRLVLFASTRLHHRVMPSTAPARCCFTIWLSQTRRRSFVREAPSLSAMEAHVAPGDAAAAVRFLLHPHVRPHVVKHAYAQEWARSLEESHGDSPERAAMLQQHWKEVSLIERLLSRHLPVAQRLAKGELSAGVEWF